MSRDELIERASDAHSDAAAEIAAASTLDDLTDIDRRYLGKGSPLNTVREAIKTVDGPDRAAVGQAVSAARTLIEENIAARRDALSAGDRDAALDAERLRAATIASAIEINRPVNLPKALRALDQCGGVVREATDQEILDAKAKVDQALWTRHVAYLESFLARPNYQGELERLRIHERIGSAQATLQNVSSPAYRASLVGMIGADPALV